MTNSDENLLHALAADERERMQSRPEEWDELARGALDPDVAVARVRARGAVDEGDLVHARELFTPPPAAFDDAIVDRLVAMARANGTVAAPVASTPAPSQAAEVIHVPPTWWQRKRALVAAGVMAAAAAVLVFAWPRPATDDASAARIQLPRHELWIEADAEVRGSATDVQRLAPGAPLRLYLRPDRGYDVTPSVAACLRKGDETRVLPLQPSAAKPGETFDVATRLPDDLADGRWEIVALVAGGALPDDIAASCAAPPSDLQVARKPIDVAR